MKKILKNKQLVTVLLLTLAAFALRFGGISSNPPSLNWDEASHGYNAFSILKTGKDEWGKSFPLIFRTFGDYKLPVYIYLTTIPVAILGLNIVSTRLISVIAGTLAIPGIYLLFKQLFPKLKLKIGKFVVDSSLLAAFLLAINPWHFFISRPALEANLSLTLIIFAVWALLKASKKPSYYLLSSILFSLSLHTYNTARVFVPTILIAWFIIYRPKFKVEAKQVISALILSVSIGLVIYQVLTGSGTARYSKLAILSPSVVFQIGQNRLQSQLPEFLARLRFNRPVYFVQAFIKNYLSYFSLPFFYQVKGAQQQFAIPVKNMLTLPVHILAIIGFFKALASSLKSSSKGFKFILSWLILAPVAAALTADPPQALRPNPMIPALIILAVIGLHWLISLFKKYSWAQKILLPGLLLIITFGFYRYHQTYWQSYRYDYASAWQYGYQQAIDYVQENKDQYDRVFISKKHGEPHIFYAFHAKLDPYKLWPSNPDNIRFNQSDWYWTDKIGSVYFVNAWDIPSYRPAEGFVLESDIMLPTKNSLLVTTPLNVPSNGTILKIIEYPQSRNIAFVILKLN